MHLRLLRLFLVFGGLTWGAPVFSIFMTWEKLAEALDGLGAQTVTYDPMLDYWLRMAAGAYTLFGGLFLLLALKPLKYRTIIPWFGVFMLLEGIILLVHGLRLSLPPFPFYADTGACFVGGTGILWCSSRADFRSGENQKPDNSEQ